MKRHLHVLVLVSAVMTAAPAAIANNKQFNAAFDSGQWIEALPTARAIAKDKESAPDDAPAAAFLLWNFGFLTDAAQLVDRTLALPELNPLDAAKLHITQGRLLFNDIVNARMAASVGDKAPDDASPEGKKIAEMVQHLRDVYTQALDALPPSQPRAQWWRAQANLELADVDVLQKHPDAQRARYSELNKNLETAKGSDRALYALTLADSARHAGLSDKAAVSEITKDLDIAIAAAGPDNAYVDQIRQKLLAYSDVLEAEGRLVGVYRDRFTFLEKIPDLPGLADGYGDAGLGLIRTHKDVAAQFFEIGLKHWAATPAAERNDGFLFYISNMYDLTVTPQRLIEVIDPLVTGQSAPVRQGDAGWEDLLRLEAKTYDTLGRTSDAVAIQQRLQSPPGAKVAQKQDDDALAAKREAALADLSAHPEDLDLAGKVEIQADVAAGEADYAWAISAMNLVLKTYTAQLPLEDYHVWNVYGAWARAMDHVGKSEQAHDTFRDYFEQLLDKQDRDKVKTQQAFNAFADYLDEAKYGDEAAEVRDFSVRELSSDPMMRNGPDNTARPQDIGPLEKAYKAQQAAAPTDTKALVRSALSLAAAYRQVGRDRDADGLVDAALKSSKTGTAAADQLLTDEVDRLTAAIAGVKKAEDSAKQLAKDVAATPRSADNYYDKMYKLLFDYESRLQESQQYDAAIRVAADESTLSPAVGFTMSDSEVAGRLDNASNGFDGSCRFHVIPPALFRPVACWTAAVQVHRQAVRKAFQAVEKKERGDTGLRDPGDLEHRALRKAVSDFIFAADWLSAVVPDQAAALSAESFEFAENARSGGAADAVERLSERRETKNDREAALIRERQDLVRSRAGLESTRLMALRDGQSNATEDQELATVRRRISSIDAELGTRAPQGRSLALAQLQGVLSASEAVVSYMSEVDVTHIWVVRHDGIKMYRRALKSTDVVMQRNAFNAALNPDQGLAKLNVEAGAKLYGMVWSAIEGDVADITSVIVIPDGPLNNVPFAALVTGTPSLDAWLPDASWRPHWLIERHAFTYMPAAGALVELRRGVGASQARQPMIGFGDPVLAGGGKNIQTISSLYRNGVPDMSVIRSLPPLPETRAEILSVGRALGAGANAAVLGPAMTKPDLEHRDLSQYKVLIFATHGFSATRTREAALVFTPPQALAPDDNGLLAEHEIAQLKLDAELTVLSACRTAVDPTSTADQGLPGLARAFLFAGSRAAMVTLWPLESEAATSLTTGVFDALAKDPSAKVAQALRSSMLKMVESHGQSAHPVFWAPFLLVGEPVGPVIAKGAAEGMN